MNIRKSQSLILVEQIEPRILLIRGQRAILDADLADLYGTTTKRLNEQVKRNQGRFPADFMFQLTAEEAEAMRSQIVTESGPPPAMRSQIATANLRSQIATSSSARHGGRRHLPYAFTDQSLVAAIRRLMQPPPTASQPRIGFHIRPENEL